LLGELRHTLEHDELPVIAVPIDFQVDEITDTVSLATY
jgi:hypothetical protein